MRLVAALILAAALAPPAVGSQLLDRNATHVKLELNAKGEALITYRVGAKLIALLIDRAAHEAAGSQDPAGAHTRSRRDRAALLQCKLVQNRLQT